MNSSVHIIMFLGLTWLTTVLALQNCTNPNYYYFDHLKKIKRFQVPERAVPWDMPFPEYQPPEFTSPHLPPKPHADPDIHDPAFEPEWNSVDGLVNRTTNGDPYKIIDGYPMNPGGRTGIRGRGVLPRWGPNHEANSIVTRWKRGFKGRTIHFDSEKPILQVAIIRRHGCFEWNLPGGLVEINSDESTAMQRQLLEEALNLEYDVPPEIVLKYQDKITEAFGNRSLIYRGYVKDPRNTDNAWIESAVFLVHDEKDQSVATLPLPAEDETDRPVWRDVDNSLPLLPSNYEWVKTIATKLKAHW